MGPQFSHADDDDDDVRCYRFCMIRLWFLAFVAVGAGCSVEVAALACADDDDCASGSSCFAGACTTNAIAGEGEGEGEGAEGEGEGEGTEGEGEGDPAEGEGEASEGEGEAAEGEGEGEGEEPGAVTVVVVPAAVAQNSAFQLQWTSTAGDVCDVLEGANVIDDDVATGSSALVAGAGPRTFTVVCGGAQASITVDPLVPAFIDETWRQEEFDTEYREYRLELDVSDYGVSKQPALVVSLDLARVLAANGLPVAFDPDSVRAVRRSDGSDVVEYFHTTGGGLFFFTVGDPRDPDVDVYFTATPMERPAVWQSVDDDTVNERGLGTINIGLEADLGWRPIVGAGFSDRLRGGRGVRVALGDAPAMFSDIPFFNLTAPFQEPQARLRRRETDGLGLYETVVGGPAGTVIREFVVVAVDAVMVRVVTRIEAGSGTPAGRLSVYADPDLVTASNDTGAANALSALVCSSDSNPPGECVAWSAQDARAVTTGRLADVRTAWVNGALTSGARSGTDDQALALDFDVPPLQGGESFVVQSLVSRRATSGEDNFADAVAATRAEASAATSAVVTPGLLWHRRQPD